MHIQPFTTFIRHLTQNKIILKKDKTIGMYLDESGFIISGWEIIEIIFIISIGYTILKFFGGKILNITVRFDEHDDYPGSTKLSEDRKNEKNYRTIIEDAYLYSEMQEKMIFEENISGVPFRYDEKTRVLTIGQRFNNDGPHPIDVNLDSFDDFREFVDRLEEYINE